MPTSQKAPAFVAVIEHDDWDGDIVAGFDHWPSNDEIRTAIDDQEELKIDLVEGEWRECIMHDGLTIWQRK